MSNKKEVWKLISFQGKKPSIPYAVSNLGRFGVMDKKGQVEVRTFQPQAGGFRYNYKINGKSKAIFVYKEVARAFLKKPSPKQTFVIRKDHNYLNDSVDNLKWVTPEEHRAHVTVSPHAILSRKKRAITKSHTAKVFDEKSIREVKKLIWDPKRKLTFKQIAKKYGVSEMQIYRIKSGELWFHIHVPNEPVSKKYKTNLQNIEFQEKKSEKEKAAKQKLNAARLAQKKKAAENRAKAKAEKEKRKKERAAKRKARLSEASKKRAARKLKRANKKVLKKLKRKSQKKSKKAKKRRR